MSSMKRILLLLAACLLLTGCTAALVPPEEGQPGHASCRIDLTTDGRCVYLLRREETLPAWARTYKVYEVTGGGMRRVVGGRDADDFAVLDGVLWIASHTADWLKPVRISAELDGYDPMDGMCTLHVSARDESQVNPDRYAFHMAGGRLICQRTFVANDGSRQEFALIDVQGRAGEVFHTLPYVGAAVTDTFIAGAAYRGDEVCLFDLSRMETYMLPAMWGRDQFGDVLLPEGVLLDGVLYYPAADGVHAYDLAAGQDGILAAMTAPEYFYVTGGWLYAAADKGFLTAFDLRTGAARPTGIALTKADRYVIAGRSAYILQTPERHGVREYCCRVEKLPEWQ